MNTFLTTQQLANRFQGIFSESALKKSRMANPTCEGPPWRMLSGSRKVIYVLEDVLKWLDARPQRQCATIRPVPQLKKRIGRPTKMEQIARRLKD